MDCKVTLRVCRNELTIQKDRKICSTGFAAHLRCETMVFPWICSNACVQPPRRYLRSIPFRCQIEGVGSKGTECFTIWR